MTDATQGRATECGMSDTSRRRRRLGRKDVVRSQIEYSTPRVELTLKKSTRCFCGRCACAGRRETSDFACFGCFFSC